MDAEVSELGSGIESADCPVWRTAYQLSVKGKEPTTATTGTISFWPSITPMGDRAVYPGWGRKPDQAYPAGAVRPGHRRRAGYGYTYDAEDRLTQVTGPSGEVVAAYVYDRMGNCIERKDALGAATTMPTSLEGSGSGSCIPWGRGQPQEARGAPALSKNRLPLR